MYEGMDPVQIGKKLKGLREQKGESAEELSKALNISASAVAMYETGKRIPRDEIKIRIAEHFVVPVESIFFSEQTTRYVLMRGRERVEGSEGCMAAVAAGGDDQPGTAGEGGRGDAVQLQPGCTGGQAEPAAHVAREEPADLEGAGDPADRRMT